jgi:hypothetical protein
VSYLRSSLTAGLITTGDIPLDVSPRHTSAKLSTSRGLDIKYEHYVGSITLEQRGIEKEAMRRESLPKEILLMTR